MARKRNLVEAVGYMRTSSATNVGHDRNSEKRQRAAIEGYAKAAGYVIVDWFHDAPVSGADPIAEHRSLREMAAELARQGHLSELGTPFSPMVVSRMLKVSDAAIAASGASWIRPVLRQPMPSTGAIVSISVG